MRIAFIRFVIVSLATAIMVASSVLAAASCSRSIASRGYFSYQPHDSRSVDGAQPSGESIDSTGCAGEGNEVSLLDSAGLQPPPGTDAALNALLVSEFRRALKERERASGVRIVSAPPQGDAGRVLTLAFDADSGMLSWTYANLADYDMSGEVGIPDITLIAVNYLELVGIDPALGWVDGNRDGEIGIPDITPIAENYLNEVSKYEIVTSDDAINDFTAIGSVDFGQNGGGIPLAFESPLPDGAKKYVRVRPVDSAGTPGTLSNTIQPLSPRVVSVSPTGGNEGAQVTFSATVTGGGPFTYDWDFGGAADPATSTEESPTVTLLDGGSYLGTVTVETPYGVGILDFTIDVVPKTYAVSGAITFEDAPLVGVSVEMTGQTAQITDDDGAFAFTGVINGTYTVTPNDPMYEFDPVSREVVVYKTDYSGVDFVASPGTFDVSGSITNDADLPLAGVTVNASDGANDYQAFTVGDGTFTFSGLPNGTYTLTPDDEYMTFTPASLDIVGAGEPQSGKDFFAEAYHPFGAYPFKTGQYNDLVVRFERGTQIQVYVGDGTGIQNYDPAFVQSAKDGMAQWNAVADRWGLFHVSYTDTFNDAEIEVEWVRSLGGNAAGRASWSSRDGVLELPLLIELATTVDGSPATTSSIYDVSTHEIGHALGIWDHSEREEDVMFPISYTGTPSKRDEYEMYVVYHTPADITDQPQKRGGFPGNLGGSMNSCFVAA